MNFQMNSDNGTRNGTEGNDDEPDIVIEILVVLQISCVLFMLLMIGFCCYSFISGGCVSRCLAGECTAEDCEVTAENSEGCMNCCELCCHLMLLLEAFK